ncbi:MAG: hypothetical protein ACTHN7_00030 [Solirubrobacterales bacterium]
MKRNLIYVTALAAGLVLILVSGAAGERKEECAGNLCIVDDGGISPSKLPKHGSAPITARIFGELKTRDGSHPPALQTLELDVDRTIGLDAVGLPTCRPGQLEARNPADARRVCHGAIVGLGSAEVEVAFPEQAPFRSRGPLTLFNAGVHGKTTDVLLHAYVDVPAPTAIVIRATVTRIHHGPFGLHVAMRIPKIAGGAGSPTAFKLKIGRRFTYKGHQKSFLTGSCPTGHWTTKGHVVFSDGTQLGLTHVFACTPKA